MGGKFTIDGVEAWSCYGAWVLQGGYGGLLSYPPVKEPDTNDWKEEDGLECDLSAPKLSAMEIALSGPRRDVPGFMGRMSAVGVRQLGFPTLGRTFALRYEECTSYRKYAGLEALRLRFSMDAPDREGLWAWKPAGVRVPVSAYTLDGVGLEHYGLFVEAGREELLRPAGLKRQLAREVSTLDGREYDTGMVSRREKAVTFKCCMKAADMERMWSCRDSFLAALTAPGWRTLRYGGRSYESRYLSAQGFRFAALRRGLVMVEFEVTLSVNREV